jgi:hypothetical protein
MELFWFKEIDVTEGLIKQHTEKLHDFYSSPNILGWHNRGALDGGEERMFDTERNGTRFLSNFGNHLQANTI